MEMVVYEAITDADLTKIVQFMQAQPTGYATTCFQALKVTFDIQWFKTMKAMIPNLETFVCEDATGAIRVVWGKHVMGESKGSAVVFGFMSEADYQAGNIQYLKELCVWLVRNESRGIRRHFNNYLTNDTYLKFMQEIFGTTLKVIDSREINGTIMYQLVIDVQAFKATLATT